MIGIEAHQRGQIEGHGKTRLALAKEVAIAGVGFFCRGEARELAHGPEPAAIHVAMNAAGVRELARSGIHRFDVRAINSKLLPKARSSGTRMIASSAKRAAR